MGYILTKEGFDAVVDALKEQYRLYAPVLKKGEGRFTDTDVVRYDFVETAGQIELEKKSDYAFKELLTPLSETLFFFTEDAVKPADADLRPVIVFLRSCDLHAVKRLDQIYLANGKDRDWFYQRIRDCVRFALIGCGRCNFVCPTCTCYTMQDVYYTDNGKVGERRRVASSCMVDGYTDVAGGGQYRKSCGERMRFKVLHKVYDYRRRFGYDMCVGCGRCDAVCPEYISFSACINKLDRAVKEAQSNG